MFTMLIPGNLPVERMPRNVPSNMQGHLHGLCAAREGEVRAEGRSPFSWSLLNSILIAILEQRSVPCLLVPPLSVPVCTARLRRVEDGREDEAVAFTRLSRRIFQALPY